MESYDPDEVKARLAELTREQVTTAVAGVAEWMFPLWERYADSSQDDTGNTVRSLLDEVWDAISSGEELPDAEETLDALAPDEESDDYGNKGAPAENALSAVAYAVRAWRSETTPQEGEWGLRQLYDAADYLVESVLPDDASLDPEERDEAGDRLLRDAVQGIDDAITRAAEGRSPDSIRQEFAARGRGWAEGVL